MSVEKKVILTLVLLSVVAGVLSYSALPSVVASHWSLFGNANGYMPKQFAVFFFPLLMLVLAGVFLLIPIIDPLRANIEQFKKDYYRFCIAVLVFFFIIFIQSILWNLGTQISFSLTIPILLGLLFIYIGEFFKKTKQSWLIGIRTPWTMSSPEVWEKTHQLGAVLFEICGIVMILSVLFQPYGLLIPIAMILLSAVALVVYSYVEYDILMKGKTMKKGGRKKPESSVKDNKG